VTPAPAEVLALAEDLNVSLPPSPRSDRVVTDRYAVVMGERALPAFTVVQRLRLDGEDVTATVDEVRDLLARRGRTAATWEVGSSARPQGLVARLQALGMRDFDEPHVVGMVLGGTPAWSVPDVEVRRAASVDDYVAAAAIMAEGFGEAPEADDVARERAARALAAERDVGRDVTFLAFLDGAPVAAAKANVTPHALVLGAAATRTAARGRGAYRALVAARLEEARRLGAPWLVTQAGSMSRPILQRLGFEEVCTIHVLLDER
jgi:hypothetical protein